MLPSVVVLFFIMGFLVLLYCIIKYIHINKDLNVTKIKVSKCLDNVNLLKKQITEFKTILNDLSVKVSDIEKEVKNRSE